jgi:eukaryotic-like serine/threonine-protein kinase
MTDKDTCMEKIGRYEIVGELGRGAMGVVYRAIDPNIGRTVALKTTRLDVDATERKELVLRFRNEAHAAGQMNHPNIVTIHDADECEGLFYIAMECLEGETLQSLMGENRLTSSAQIVDIARQVAVGLEYAHSMRVVHRDIKPANIMITRQGVAKIMDFGISKSVGTLTRSGQILGTPYYMSPEQVMGHTLDGRSDLFSFGVVLYEIATGARPFGGDTVATVIYKIINENPLPACELHSTVHPGLSAVIARALEKKPQDRYQTGAELAADLEKIIYPQPGERACLSPANERTQQIAFHQLAPEATARAANTAMTAAHPVGASAGIEERQHASRIAPATTWSKAKKPVVWIAAAVLVVVASIGVRNARHRRPALQQLPGGASIIVNVPARLGNRGHHEIAEKRELQKVRASDRPAPTPSPASPAKAETPPVQRTVSISFTSSPEGASIRLDGQSNPEWVTPYTIADIVPGSHRVEIIKEGYSPEIRDVDIGPRDAPYGVDLVPK